MYAISAVNYRRGDYSWNWCTHKLTQEEKKKGASEQLHQKDQHAPYRIVGSQ